jgi:hypothetical protein
LVFCGCGWLYFTLDYLSPMQFEERWHAAQLLKAA